MLLLKKHLVDLVRAGKKRQTIRLWSRPLVQAGKISYAPGLGKIKIIAVDALASFDQLTEQDALADGFASRDALLAELRTLYGDTPPEGKHVYRIVFDWPVAPVEAGKPAAMASPDPVAAAPRRRGAARKSARPVAGIAELPASGRDDLAAAKVSAPGAMAKSVAPPGLAMGAKARQALKAHLEAGNPFRPPST